MFEFFGWFVVFTIPLAIIVPYYRRQSDLFTAWNLLLLSVWLNIGIGTLEVIYTPFHWKQLEWFSISESLKAQYVLGGVVFLCSLFLSYYGFQFAKRLSYRRLAKWPPNTSAMLLSVVAGCFLIVLVALFAPRVPVLSAILSNVSHKAAILGPVFALAYWRRSRTIGAIALFAGIILYAGMFALLVSGGRRLLLSVACIPVFAYYWWYLRYRSPITSLTRMGLAGVFLVLLMTGYSSFRWFNKGLRAEVKDRNVSTILEQISRLNWQKIVAPLQRDALHFGGQYCGYYSLLGMYYLENDARLEVEPLQSIKWVVCYPIPRVYWEEKPETIGIRMPRLARVGSSTNWGIGIIGHGFIEGGYPTLMLYGFLLAISVRFLDTPLQRSPDNPFLLALLCITAPHIVTWIRGDMAVVAAEILEGVAFVVILGACTRVVFGTEKLSFRAMVEATKR